MCDHKVEDFHCMNDDNFRKHLSNDNLYIKNKKYHLPHL